MRKRSRKRTRGKRGSQRYSPTEEEETDEVEDWEEGGVGEMKEKDSTH